MFLHISFLLFFCVINLVSCGEIREEFTWTRITYKWPSVKKESSNVTVVFPEKKGRNEDGNVPKDVSYIFENNIPMGANIWKNKLFIGVPRRRFGVPSTLNYVNLESPIKHNVPLIPYPNWDVNQLDYKGEDKLVSIYRFAIDPCDRLCSVDSGSVNSLGDQRVIQPVSVVIIDLNTDTIIRKHPLPKEFIAPTSGLVNLVVDVTADSCSDAYAYIPDLGGYKMVVYSFKEDKSWKVHHNYFHLEPLRGNFFVGGVNFQWDDGIFSIGLSGVDENGDRSAYFHAMAGTNMFNVSTKILKNVQLATRSFHGSDFNVLGDRGEGSQTSASAIHQPSGAYFLGLVNQNGLGCWNINKPFKKENFDIVQKDDKKMIYPADVKVTGDKVIMLTNAMPVFLYKKLNYDEVNFRVWVAHVENAVNNTVCA